MEQIVIYMTSDKSCVVFCRDVNDTVDLGRL